MGEKIHGWATTSEGRVSLTEGEVKEIWDAMEAAQKNRTAEFIERFFEMAQEVDHNAP